MQARCCGQWQRRKRKMRWKTTFAVISSENQKVVAHETVIMVNSWVGQRNCISHFGRHTKRRRSVQKLHSSFCLELMPACTMLIWIFFKLLVPSSYMYKIREERNLKTVSLSAVLLEKKKKCEESNSFNTNVLSSQIQMQTSHKTMLFFFLRFVTGKS